MQVERSQLHSELTLADFDLDSLGYIRIKRSLETSLGRAEPLSMPALLSCRTIADLDTLLFSIGSTTSESDPIVPLATSGSRQPLVLCHPGGGAWSGWVNILKYLPDRPLYALRARGFHAGDAPFQSLDEMLDTYIAGIRRYLPHGPYALLGSCFGGMLAFELTKRSEAANEKVVFCGGLDNPPDLGVLANQMGRDSDANFLIDLLHFYQVLTFEEAHALEIQMRNVADEVFIPALCAHFPAGTLESVDLTPSGLRAWLRINRNMQQIAKDYRPSGKVSKYDVFWVPPKRDVLDVTHENWLKQIGPWEQHVSHVSVTEGHQGGGPKEAFRMHPIHGNHYTMILPENMDTF